MQYRLIARCEHITPTHRSLLDDSILKYVLDVGLETVPLEKPSEVLPHARSPGVAVKVPLGVDKPSLCRLQF